jgi:hypothetical protein
MPEFTVTIDTKELEKDLDAIGQSIIPKAGASAINKTLSHANTLSVRSLARATGLTQAKVRPYLKVEKAIPSRLVGYLTASGKHIPLIEFPHSKVKKGIKAKVWGKWQLFPRTFYARMPAGHLGIFSRKGSPQTRIRWRRTKTGRRVANQPGQVRPRLPIGELWGPSVPKEFREFIMDARVRQAIQNKLGDNYAHELKWRVDKLKGN